MLDIEPVTFAESSKILQLTFNYTNGKIKLYRVSSYATQGEYSYSLWVDCRDMKRIPARAVLNNIVQFINGVISCMRSY